MVRGRRRLLWEVTSVLLAKLHNCWTDDPKGPDEFNLVEMEERQQRPMSKEELDTIDREIEEASAGN